MRLENPAAIIGNFVNAMIVLMKSLAFRLIATRTVLVFAFVKSLDVSVCDIVCA